MQGFTAASGWLLAGYCLLILLSSLAGGWLPMRVRLTHTRLQVATSFVAGLMLGVGVLHLLPHAWFQLQSMDRVAAWLLGGFLLMFFVQRFFHFHHHDVPDEDPEACGTTADVRHDFRLIKNPPAPTCDHHDHHPHAHTLADKSARHLSWGGAALGLTLHTLIDGLALAASVAAEAHGDFHGGVAGLGTFLVIILHKPFDAMAISTLMAVGGWPKASRHLINGLFALAIPAGVLLFHLGANQFVAHYPVILGSALAFAAGTFVCIAASDLLPELQFHSHDRIKLSLALLLGLGLAVAIGALETTGHEHHEHGEKAAAPAIQ